MSSTGKEAINTAILGEWDGDPSTYPEHRAQREAFKEVHDQLMRRYRYAKHPDNREAVEEDYTVPYPEDGKREDLDDLGAEPGERVKKENTAAKNKAKYEFEKKDRKYGSVYGSSLKGGQAHDIMLEMASKGPLRGKELEAAVDKVYENSTNNHISELFLQWISTEKPADMPTDQWTTQWSKTEKLIKQQLKWDQMASFLYLKNLGITHKQFRDIHTADDRKLDLRELMRFANDWKRKIYDEDEARTAEIGMSATTDNANKTIFRGTKRPSDRDTWTSLPCNVCAHPMHCERDCFRGGLSHLNKQERGAWLEMKRQARGDTRDYSQPPWKRQKQQQQQEQAKLSAEAKSQLAIVTSTLEDNMLHGVLQELKKKGVKLGE